MYNQLTALDTSANPDLQTLYCYNNQLRTLNLTHNPALEIFSCANNQLTELDITHNTALWELECGGSYLTALDISRNTNLKIFYCDGSYINALDLHSNSALTEFGCSSSDIKTLDLSSNPSLQQLYCSGLTLTQNLDITQSGREDFPYQVNLRDYIGDSFTKITRLTAHMRDGTEIPSQFSPSEGIARFSSSPIYIVYDYPTGYTGHASSSDVPQTISVKLSIPTSGWIYLPKVEPHIKDPSDDVKYSSAPDTAPETQLGRISSPTKSDTVIVPTLPGTQLQPEIQSGDQHPILGSSSGGCDSGFGLSILLCLLCLAGGKKRKLLVLALILTLAPGSGAHAQGGVKASDYLLPIPFEVYTPAGSYDLGFEFTQELAQTVAEKYRVSADRVHSYADIALPGTWNFRPQDMAYLANNGRYGGVLLPVTEYMTSGDVYVLKCTFSNDIQPGELIAGILAVEVDPDTRDSFYDSTKSYTTESLCLDENLNQIEAVPENRTIYLAVVRLRTNTAVLTVVRGKYVEEDDPAARLGPEAVQRIADDLGIASSDLKLLTRSHISQPVEATEDMKAFVKSDDYEIVANFPTVSVDVPGMYIIPTTLSGDVWEMLQSQDIRDYRFYALNDSTLGDKQVQPAFISGLVSTWELFTMTGERMDSFGVKEFLLVGLLEAGKPFSFYLAKMIITLLLAGCDSGINPSVIHIAITILIAREILKRRSR